jgi:hypothetical protein
VQSLLKLAIAHLLEDVGIPRLVDLEGFAAVGVDDFVHGGHCESCSCCEGGVALDASFWRSIDGLRKSLDNTSF